MARNTLKNPYGDYKDKIRSTATNSTRSAVTDTSPGRKPKNTNEHAKSLMKQASQKKSTSRVEKTASKGYAENPLSKGVLKDTYGKAIKKYSTYGKAIKK